MCRYTLGHTLHRQVSCRHFFVRKRAREREKRSENEGKRCERNQPPLVFSFWWFLWPSFCLSTLLLTTEDTNRRQLSLVSTGQEENWGKNWDTTRASETRPEKTDKHTKSKRNFRCTCMGRPSGHTKIERERGNTLTCRLGHCWPQAFLVSPTTVSKWTHTLNDNKWAQLESEVKIFVTGPVTDLHQRERERERERERDPATSGGPNTAPALRL